MPFDDDDSVSESKIKIKKVSSQKSIFDGIPKKSSYEEFSKKVDSVQEKNNSHKIKAAELSSQFYKVLNDKTLRENKTIFSKSIEKDLLLELINLSIEINNDQFEKEGMGSLTLITLLFNSLLLQRDKINNLEFELSKLKEHKSEK